jgi:hypothetical protein
MTTQLSFPEILTENLTIEFDFTLEKCESLITQLENTQLDDFGSGSAEVKERKRRELIDNALKSYIVGNITTKEYPLIANSVFEITRWYKVEFPKDSRPFVSEDSFIEPEKKSTRSKDTEIRWARGKYLVQVSKNQKSAELVRLTYARLRNTMAVLRSLLPVNVPSDVEKLEFLFTGKLLRLVADLCDSKICNRYLNTNSYHGTLSLLNRVNSYVVWAPKIENIYIDEVVLPPPGDPALVVQWQNFRWLISTWDTNNDDSKLQSIISEFLIG